MKASYITIHPLNRQNDWGGAAKSMCRFSRDISPCVNAHSQRGGVNVIWLCEEDGDEMQEPGADAQGEQDTD